MLHLSEGETRRQQSGVSWAHGPLLLPPSSRRHRQSNYEWHVSIAQRQDKCLLILLMPGDCLPTRLLPNSRVRLSSLQKEPLLGSYSFNYREYELYEYNEISGRSSLQMLIDYSFHQL